MFAEISIDIRKLKEYCLNPNHPVGKHKARVFLSQLGIERSDAQWLKEKIMEKMKDIEIEWAYEDQYGKRCSAEPIIAQVFWKSRAERCATCAVALAYVPNCTDGNKMATCGSDSTFGVLPSPQPLSQRARGFLRPGGYVICNL